MTLLVPERASTSIAVSNGPNSRTTTFTMIGPNQAVVAPTSFNCEIISPMTTKPKAHEMKRKMGSTCVPVRACSL